MAEPHLNPSSSYIPNSIPTFEQWSSMVGGPNATADDADDQADFPKSSQDFFKMLGKPPPPMPTLQEARAEATALSQEIFSAFETLQAILQRHESTIRKRWMKKSREQRKKILTDVMPDIPLDHRPDVSAFAKESKEQRMQGSKYLAAYECPYINLEDLSKPRNLLLFLNSRGRNTPDIFAGSDFAVTHLGRVSEVIVRSFLNGHTMFLSGRSDKDSYGKIVPWDEDQDAFESLMIGSGMQVGDGLNTMKQQKTVLRFLISCCEKIMQLDASVLVDDQKTQVQPEPAPIPAYLDPDTGGFGSLKAMKEEEPYRLPEQLDFERLKGLLSAKRREAEDHLWALREDPGYFTQTAMEYRGHQQPLIPDRFGQLHPIVSVPKFWDVIIRKVVGDAYQSLAMWKIAYESFSELARLREKHASGITPGKRLPKEYEAVFVEFKCLLDKMVLLPIEQMKAGFTASPPMRRLWERFDDQHKNTFRATYKGKIGKDKLTWVLMLFGDQMQRFLLGLDVIVEQVERIISTQPDQNERLSSFIADVFSEIAFIVELQREVKSYQPWAGMFEGASAWDQMEVEAKYNRKTESIKTFLETLKGIPMGKFGDPSTKKFVYPSERKPTEVTVEAMRSAELNLDVFWRFVDTEVKKKFGEKPEVLFPYQSQVRELQRTPPWVPPLPKPSKPSGKVKTPTAADTTFTTFKDLSVSEQTAAAASATVTSAKQKIKTRGEPSTAASSSAAITFDTSIQPGTLDVQPAFRIDRRAFKVLSTLFNSPSNDHPGEIPWVDFLHAMVQTGFKPQKLYGSVWQFTPTELDVERSIQFHEPHPGSKIPYRVCRRHGRRLNRAYGWVGGMFELQ